MADAPVEAMTEAAVDASTESALSDSRQADVSVDEGFCTAHTSSTFCEDFDDRSTLSPEWSQTAKFGGTLTLGAPAKSPPNALGFFAPMGNSPRAGIDRSFFGLFKRVTCELDFYFDKLDGGGDPDDGLIVEVGNEAGGIGKYVQLTSSTLSADHIANGGPQQYYTSPGVLSWTHYLFIVDFETQEATVSHGGPTTTLKLEGYPTAEKVVLSFGIAYPQSGAVAYRIDNITCDLAQ